MQSTWRDCFQSDSWVEAAKILIQSIWWQAWDYVFITNPWLILMQMAQGHDLRNSAVSNRVVGVFLLQKDVPRLSCPHYRKTDISCGQGMFWTMILSSNCMFESIGEVLWKYQYMEYIPKDFDWVGVGMEFWLPRPFNHPPLISLLPHPGLRPCYSKCISG